MIFLCCHCWVEPMSPFPIDCPPPTLHGSNSTDNRLTCNWMPSSQPSNGHCALHTYHQWNNYATIDATCQWLPTPWPSYKPNSSPSCHGKQVELDAIECTLSNLSCIFNMPNVPNNFTHYSHDHSKDTLMAQATTLRIPTPHTQLSPPPNYLTTLPCIDLDALKQYICSQGQ